MGGSESKLEENKPAPETPMKDLTEKGREERKSKQLNKLHTQLVNKTLIEVRKKKS